MRRRYVILPLGAALIVLAAGLAGLGLSLSHSAGNQGNSEPVAAAVPQDSGAMHLGEFVPADSPKPAPPASFRDSAGTTGSLAEFRGKIVLVNLWATWCAPCLREMPTLDRLAGDMAGKDFAVVLIAEDRGGAAKVDPFFKKLGLANLRTWLDPKGEIEHAFGARGLPTTILIGRDGTVLGRVEGAAEWNSAKNEALIRELIARQGSAAAG